MMLKTVLLGCLLLVTMVASDESLDDDDFSLSSHRQDDAPVSHVVDKRFLWTLTQEPFLYGGRDEGEDLRDINKRPFPRWFSTYMYRRPNYPIRMEQLSENKRFQPFHPLARFRGMSLTSSAGGSGSSVSRIAEDRENVHQPYFPSIGHTPRHYPTHPVPSDSRPIALEQTASRDFSDTSDMEDDDDIDVNEKQLTAGDLLRLLNKLPNNNRAFKNRSFRFGLSRK